ncbi:zinc ribbon domain-containing protein [Desulfoferrobacter suflitae]|uniref:zinc ribbon domain-containing protein n=1 Tax=Desulfoferrobacter suflitae TaxID=2865782 RepID=UPI0033905243
MFFFIGGVQPKTVILDETPGLCPVCGLAQARLKRTDHYISLFFIPLIRVKRGDPVLMCERCGAAVSADQSRESPGVLPHAARCRACGASLDPAFRYCPQCGSRI